MADVGAGSDDHTWWERLRRKGWLRPSIIGPLLLAICFLAVACWGYQLTGSNDGLFKVDDGGPTTAQTQAQPDDESKLVPTNEVTQRVWATLAMFAGGYVPLDEAEDPVPTPERSLVSSLALGLTFLAAGSLLLLSRKVQDFVRTLRRTPGLVVIGDGATASAIIRSAIKSGGSTILVTDSRESPVARATKAAIPIIAVGQVDGLLSTPSARRVIRRAKHVVVATDADALNMELHQLVRKFRIEQSKDPVSDDAAPDTAPTDIVVIHNPEYAELLTPAAIHRQLPTEEVTCPAKNIAEHVCQLLVAAVTGRPRIDGAVVEIDIVAADETSPPALGRNESAIAEFTPGLATTIEAWVTRLGWSMSLVRGADQTDSTERRKTLPTIEMRDASEAPPSAQRLRVRVYLGRSPSAVAAQAIAAFDDAAPNHLVIAVTNVHLVSGAHRLRRPPEQRSANAEPHTRPERVQRARDWIAKGAKVDGGFPLLVVDPDDIGLDSALVTDDWGTQWARTFDLTHGLMYANANYSVTAWQPGAPMGGSTRRLERAARKKVSKYAFAAALREQAEPEFVSRSAIRRAYRKARRKAARDACKPIANRYSSHLAVEHMLVLLDRCGYELRRQPDQACPALPDLEAPVVEYIAELEHSHWLRREWPNTSRLLRRRPLMNLISDLSGSGANEYCFKGLSILAERADLDNEALKDAASYNRRIATHTYPAIAASFGYTIAKIEDRSDPKLEHPGERCSFGKCPCAGTGYVLARPVRSARSGLRSWLGRVWRWLPSGRMVRP